MEARATFARVEAVCLDLDGTLVDVVAGWHGGFRAVWPGVIAAAPAVAALGSSHHVYDAHLRLHMQDARARAGADVEWSDDFVRAGFRRLLAEGGAPRDDLADALAARYLVETIPHTPAYPDVEAVLAALAPRFRLAVISNGLGRDQRAKIECTGLAGHVGEVVISEEVGLRKPDPAIFRLALGRIGVAAGRAVYVGDNPADDVAGARAAGMAAVWLRRDGGLFDVGGDGADAAIRGLDELVGLLSP